jgi:hypothetical protein
VLRKFGRPSKALYFAPEPSPWGGVVEACVYTYPTFEIRFINKVFATLDVHGKDDRFPIGVEVGDSEQYVLDVLGRPPFHQASGDWYDRYSFS